MLIMILSLYVDYDNKNCSLHGKTYKSHWADNLLKTPQETPCSIDFYF